LENTESTLPKPANFEGNAAELPFINLGDDACLLKTYLMKPFTRKDLLYEDHVFNYRLL
jgi:hypothetical protein